jgi:hypothetical protein
MSQGVEAVCWDISAGVVGTVFGQWILYATSRSKEMAPDAIDHVGIVVFDRLYEYGDGGVLMSEELVEQDTLEVPSRYPVSSVRSRDLMGITRKTEKEFHKWLSINDDGEFRGSAYDVVNKSCVVWAIAACRFLGVPHPPNWDRIIDWAKKNEKIASILGKAGVNSRAGSQLIIPENLGNAKAYKKSDFVASTMHLFTFPVFGKKPPIEVEEENEQEQEVEPDEVYE